MSSTSDITNSSASVGAGLISDFGVGTSLNVNAIISALMQVQDAPVTELQKQETAVQSTISAYGSIQSDLSTFQTAMQSLGDITQYETPTATVANSSIASAVANSDASTGNYSLTVNQLAQSQSLIAAGQSSANTSIGAGTITFNFGTISGTSTNGIYNSGTTFTSSGEAPQTVTISSSNDSLTGIAAAINAANIGVSASVLDDGSGTPYRLSLTSTNTGAANSMSISVSGDAALQNLLDEDPTNPTGQNLAQTSVAQNAQFNINGLSVTSATNSDSTAIPGVTLNLLSAAPSSPTTISVAQDTTGATNAVNSFVSAYNTLQTALAAATQDGTSSQAAGPLVGDTNILSIEQQIQSLVSLPVAGASSTLSSLAQIGVSFGTTGELSVNNSQLQSALTSNPSGVASLFASTGTATDSLISYAGSQLTTQAGSYDVNISQLATQGNVVGSTAASTTITTGVNDTLQIDIDGTTANVTLAGGTYTAAQLASALQTAINTNSSFVRAGVSASVSQNAGVLTINSNSFGSNSVANVTGGDGETALFGTATATQGVDVAGTINGQAATGSGQTLTSTAGNSSGLSIVVNGGTTGDRGDINFTQGVVNSLDTLMTNSLASTGPVQSELNSLNSEITEFNTTISNDNVVNANELASLQAEYAALDVTLGNLNNLSTYLSSELSSSSSSSSS